jgi:hypothetical protein
VAALSRKRIDDLTEEAKARRGRLIWIVDAEGLLDQKVPDGSSSTLRSAVRAKKATWR